MDDEYAYQQPYDQDPRQNGAHRPVQSQYYEPNPVDDYRVPPTNPARKNTYGGPQQPPSQNYASPASKYPQPPRQDQGYTFGQNPNKVSPMGQPPVDNRYPSPQQPLQSPQAYPDPRAQQYPPQVPNQYNQPPQYPTSQPPRQFDPRYDQQPQFRPQDDYDSVDDEADDVDEGMVVSRQKGKRKNTVQPPQQEQLEPMIPPPLLQNQRPLEPQRGQSPLHGQFYDQREFKSPQTIQRKQKKPMYEFAKEEPPQFQTQPRPRTSNARSDMSPKQPVQFENPDEELAWKEIQNKIDQEYQKKLKQVNDEAMNKLQQYHKEHKQLLQKTQFLYENSKRPASRGSNLSRGSRLSKGSLGNVSDLSFLSSNKGGSKRNDRNRFFTPKAVPDLPKPLLVEPPEEEELTEAQVIKNFYKEYCAIVKENVTPQSQIYLVDVLEQLHFLDDEAVNDNRMGLCNLLRKHKKSLMVYSKSGEYSGESEDIIKNLFKICCAIQNLKLKQRGHNQLDDELLKSYVDAINYNHDNPDFVVMDQLNTIKSLINRKAYSLSHRQIEFIHKEFKNFFKQRKDFKEAEERTKQLKAERERQLKQQQMLQQQYQPPPKQPVYAEVKKNPVLQSQQPKSLSRAQRLQEPLEDEEPVFEYKPVSRQQQRQQPPAVLYQEPQQRQAQKSKRPWSGARPQSGARGLNSRASQPYNMRGPPSRALPEEPQLQPPVQQFQPPYKQPQAPPQASPRSKGLYGLPQNNKPAKRAPQQSSSPLLQNPSPPNRNQPEDPFNDSFGRPGQQPNYPAGGSPGTTKQNANVPPYNQQRSPYNRPLDEEPICVLKIELDGEHVEEIKVYEGDQPEEIVNRFGKQFNLSESAQQRLLMQIQDQIAAEDSFN